MKLLKLLGKGGSILMVSLVSILAIVFFFISPILEYAIEKNSKKWIGRVIVMENLNLNIFNGKLALEEVKMLEKDDNTVFFSANNIVANFTLYRLLAGDYTISSFLVSQPYLRIVQDNNGFNFDDFTASDSTAADTTVSEPFKYSVRSIQLTGGVVDYMNPEFGNKISMLDLEITSQGIAWDDKSTAIDFKFKLNTGGSIKANLGLDYVSLAYTVDLNAEKLGLELLTPYIQDVIAIDKFSGSFSNRGIIRGNLNENTDIATTGVMQLHNIMMTAPGNDTLFTMENLTLKIDSINVKNNIFDFQTLVITEPFVKFELYDNGLNNFTRLMKIDSISEDVSDSVTTVEYESSNIFAMMADYSKEIANSYVINSYNADSMVISQGRILYKDYTLIQSFTYDITDLLISSSSISSSDKRIEFHAGSTLNNTGKLEALLSVNPNDFMDMDLFYRISGMRLPDMSPYTHYYVAYPFFDGVVTYESNNTIRNKILDSKNKLFIARAELGKKLNHKNAMDVPLKLALALLKDMKGNIDLEIPVSGNLDDPDYKIGKVIWQVIKNILLKAVTSPYRLIANAVSVSEEELKGFEFSYLQESFTEKELKNLQSLIKVLKNKPEFSVEVAQYTEPAVEEEAFASWNIRKLFWRDQNGRSPLDTLTNEELISIEKITIRDSLFVAWLDSLSGPNKVPYPLQERIILLNGKEQTREKVRNLETTRNEFVKNYLITSGLDTSRFTIFTEDPLKIPASEPKPKFNFKFVVKE